MIDLVGESQSTVKWDRKLLMETHVRPQLNSHLLSAFKAHRSNGYCGDLSIDLAAKATEIS